MVCAEVTLVALKLAIIAAPEKEPTGVVPAAVVHQSAVVFQLPRFEPALPFQKMDCAIPRGESDSTIKAKTAAERNRRLGMRRFLKGEKRLAGSTATEITR